MFCDRMLDNAKKYAETAKVFNSILIGESRYYQKKIRRTIEKSDGRLKEMDCRPISNRSHQQPVPSGQEFVSQRLVIEWLKRKLPN